MFDTNREVSGTASPQTAPPRTTPPTLERRLGPLDAAAIVIANVIGVGIFTTPGIVASMVANPTGLVVVWLVGGVLAFAGAMAYAELAVRFPRAGGEYVYLKESYGPLMAFLTGWTSFVAGFSGAIAAAAVGCATFIGRFVPPISSAQPLVVIPLGIGSLTLSPRAIAAIALVAAVSALHTRGLEVGKRVQNTLAGLKVLALLSFIVFGFALGQGSLAHFGEGAPIRPTTWLAALIPVMFSYSGWNAATYVAEEIRNPTRNLPRGLGLGTLVVVVIYLALNLVYVYAVPVRDMGGVRVGEVAATRLLGSWTATALTGVTIVIIVSSISAMILAGPRVYYAMARDGLFFSSAAKIHPRFHTPSVSIVAQAVWITLLILSGSFEQLLTYTGFAVVLFAAIAVASLFVVRRRHASDARLFSAWGYPTAPAVFCGVSLLIVLNALREQTFVTLTGSGIIAAGIPLYWLFAQRHAPSRKAQEYVATERLDPIRRPIQP